MHLLKLRRVEQFELTLTEVWERYYTYWRVTSGKVVLLRKFFTALTYAILG